MGGVRVFPVSRSEEYVRLVNACWSFRETLLGITIWDLCSSGFRRRCMARVPHPKFFCQLALGVSESICS